MCSLYSYPLCSRVAPKTRGTIPSSHPRIRTAGPDYLPFSGRKSSALGTLSVTEALKTGHFSRLRRNTHLIFCVCGQALKTVSTEYVVATKDNAMGKAGMLSLAGAQCNCVASLI